MDDRRPEESRLDTNLMLLPLVVVLLVLGIGIGRAEGGCCISMDFGLRLSLLLLGRGFRCRCWSGDVGVESDF